MQEILKYILIAVTAAVLCYIGWTIYGEGTRSASARMSESVQLAQTQAQNMNSALTNVSTVGSASRNTAATSAGNVGDTQKSQPTTRVIAPVEVSEITDLNALMVEWKPRYEAAKLAYAKFAASITNAKARAADYFAQQQALTESIQDPSNRAKAEQEDAAEMLLYRQWEARADVALKTAAKIGIQLDDMDANLKKMELRADFVFDTSAFQEVPEAINELNLQLVDFQASSENIKAVSGSPFEAQ